MITNNYKISVIVPIFNTESLLEKCVNSIIEQTYNNIEIILVNDGSTDNSPEICENFKKLDNRVIVIHKKNGGRSDARNAGMEVSTGEYLMFIDSDDWIETDMVEELLKMAVSNQAEVVLSAISNENDFNQSVQYFPWKDDQKFEKNEIINRFLPHLVSRISPSGKIIQSISGSVCRCLYSSSLLFDNNIFFDTQVGSGEDKEFNIRVFTICSSLFTTNKCYYHYYRGVKYGGSSTQNYTKNHYERVKYRQHCYINTLEEIGLLETFERPLSFIWLSTILAVIRNLTFAGNPYSLSEKIIKANFILEEEDFHNLINIFSVSQLRLLNINDIRLIEKSLRLFFVKEKFKREFKTLIFKVRNYINNEN